MHICGVDKHYEGIHSRIHEEWKGGMNENGGGGGHVLLYVALFYPDGFSDKGILGPDLRQ